MVKNQEGSRYTWQKYLDYPLIPCLSYDLIPTISFKVYQFKFLGEIIEFATGQSTDWFSLIQVPVEVT